MSNDESKEARARMTVTGCAVRCSPAHEKLHSRRERPRGITQATKLTEKAKG
jgi:hypothetical protein